MAGQKHLSAQTETARSPGAVALPIRAKLGFGVGDLGFNFFWATTSLYLLYYYTDVLGLSAATAGWIFAVALIWDAVTDPVMGYIANRTRTRWGRYRPYILFGSVPLGLSFTSMFWPTGLSGSALVGFTLATHMLFRTAYTVLSMPYSSLMAAITNDSQERGSLAAFRMVAATCGGLIAAFSTLKLAAWLGDGDTAWGFLLTAALYSSLAVVIFTLTFATTAERVDMTSTEVPLTPRSAASAVIRNRAFLLVCAFTICGMAGGTFFSKTLPYYLKYSMAREDLIGGALTLLAAMIFVAVPFWSWVMRRTSKRLVALAGAGLGLSAYAVLFFIPSLSLATGAVLLLVIGLANAAGYLAFWSMMPDTVEYGEWRSGVRGEGVIFGVVSFAQKAALGIAVGVLGQLLTTVGYVANQAQSAGTIAGLHTLLSAGPFVFTALAAAFVYFYPLDADAHRKLVLAIEERKGKAQK
jgi:GPH family glycoside/pentoside/hexuronide:cation symporter